jgi:hypothetical protein
MRHFLIALTMLISAASASGDQVGDVATWATATSTHAANGRVIVFRFAKDFRPGFNRGSLPERVILVWRYQSQSGMPAAAEREAMDRLEDLLAPIVETPGQAVLSLVSTGENLREWTYYAKSEGEFLYELNRVTAGNPRFPIEIHAAPDPAWLTYERFRRGVRE